MTTTSSAAWLPAGMARAAVVSPVGPPHGAPESDDAVPGRHAEPEWDRQLFDPARDDDPFDWLGFTAS